LKKYLSIIVLIILFTACEKEQNPYLISKQNIGFLTDSSQVMDLNTIFINDSITKYIGGDEFTGNINDIDIFEKGGKHLLTLSPFEALDSTSTIKTIQIIDDRFKTSKGVSTLSTFKELQTNYKISSIQNTLSNVVISINEINAYVTIDKKELPSNMQYDMALKIEAIQIPDNAKIKNFYIHWY